MLNILFLILFIMMIALIKLWIEVVKLKSSYKNNKKIIRCEDKDFIWILKKKKWLKYNKNKDQWTIVSSPPF